MDPGTVFEVGGTVLRSWRLVDGRTAVTGVCAIACSVSVDLCLFLFTFVHIKYTVFVFQDWLRFISASLWGTPFLRFSQVHSDQGCPNPNGLLLEMLAGAWCGEGTGSSMPVLSFPCSDVLW